MTTCTTNYKHDIQITNYINSLQTVQLLVVSLLSWNTENSIRQTRVDRISHSNQLLHLTSVSGQFKKTKILQSALHQSSVYGVRLLLYIHSDIIFVTFVACPVVHFENVQKKTRNVHKKETGHVLPESVQNHWEWFTIGRLTISTMNQIIVSTDVCEQEICDEQDLCCRNDQSYRKVKVGIGASGVDPQVPQNGCHDDANTEHYCREEHVASICSEVAPHRQQRQIKCCIAKWRIWPTVCTKHTISSFCSFSLRFHG